MIKQLLSLSLFGLLSLFLYSQDRALLSAITIPNELKANANAIIRLEDFHVDIESQDEMKITYSSIVTVLNEKGNSSVKAFIGYDKYKKIKKIEGIIFDEFGQEIKKLRKKDFIDHSAVDGSTLYSDSRFLFMPYTPISYPYTVMFSYEFETSNTLALFPWSPINDYFVSIEESKYSIADKANLGLRFKEKNFNNFNIESKNESDLLNYSIKNVPAFKPEDLSPDFESFAPKVMVGTERFHYYGVNGQAKDWKQFGDWMQNELLAGRNEITNETKQKILEMTSGIEDPLERAKIVYQFVQNNTRYISVQVGIGGVQPIDALEVDQLKYGDCKGLTNYTKSLLDVAKVKSYYTIVEAGNNIVDFDDDFASLEQGNHIILGIPNNKNIVWLDCTSQIHPFGFIGNFTDNRKVFTLKPEGSEILKTTPYLDNENYQLMNASIKLNSDASIEAQLVIKSMGIQYDSRFPIERESEDNILKYYKNHWSYVNNLNIVSKKHINDKEKIEFIEDLNLRARDYASINAERLIFMPNVFNRNTYVPIRYRDRKLPFVIQRGYFDNDVFTFQIPKGYVVESIPENFEIKNKFGEYSIENSIDDTNIIFKRKLLMKKGNYTKSEYDLYRNFRKDIAKHDTSIIVLKKS